MAKKQERDPLASKLARIGYPVGTVVPGIDEVLMLHVRGQIISSVEYALALSDEQLKALIDETLAAAGGH